MRSGPTGGRIERELRIAAAPATVFAYLTEPGKLVQWMGNAALLDPRPGGGFRLDYNGADIASGTFVVVEPPRRIVFTWGWEAEGDPVPPGASTVEFTLTPDGDGTLLRLAHRDLPDPAIAGHADGWDYFLARLRAVAEGRQPSSALAGMPATV
jgi:uncharacterized protein YndB with AHSA1/START domain